jgi:hypothetical protein
MAAESTSDSGLDVGAWPPESPRADGATGDRSSRTPAAIWLNGDVLSCACPDCGSPMSIRLWLMVADCWLCGTTLELTEEQEREARRLLADQEPTAAVAAAPVAAPPPPVIPPPPPAAPPLAPAPARNRAKPAPPPKPKRKRRAATPTEPLGTRIVRAVRVWARNQFRDLPAWLTSLILHMVALILLGLLTIPELQRQRQLVLATHVGPEDLAGDWEDIAQEEEPFEFNDPGIVDPVEVEADEVLGPEPPTDIDDPFQPDNTPGVEEESIFEPLSVPVASGGVGSLFSGRDPNSRADMVRRAGGTTETEAAVARGLEWLARHQSPDGSWSLNRFHLTGDCGGRCDALGQDCDTSGTALALLPFLGAGNTHLQGQYADNVSRGIDWLVAQQQSSGSLWSGGLQLSQMYAHGQAAIALCEAYGMTQDQKLQGPAQRALDFIVAAQHSAGGWRYFPGQPGDTSVVGWQIMALRSGQMAYLNVPQESFDAASRFLDSVQQDSSGGEYAYQQLGYGTSSTMTAEALLCRQFSGWPKNHPGLQSGVRWLLEKSPPRRDDSNMYYWYYATQVMHHMGGDEWERWNLQMRNVLVDMQVTDGHAAGSWTPALGHDRFGGRVYMTALAVCTLEIYYRHMPLYQEHAPQ